MIFFLPSETQTRKLKVNATGVRKVQLNCCDEGEQEHGNKRKQEPTVKTLRIVEGRRNEEDKVQCRRGQKKHAQKREREKEVP